MSRRNRLRPSNLSRSEDIEKPTPTPIMAAESKPEQPSPQVPLPKRASRAAKEKQASKPAAKPEQREQQTAQAAPRWKPMGLAPADTPSISPRKASRNGWTQEAIAPRSGRLSRARSRTQESAAARL